jgi:hypothetical protein
MNIFSTGTHSRTFCSPKPNCRGQSRRATLAGALADRGTVFALVAVI